MGFFYKYSYCVLLFRCLLIIIISTRGQAQKVFEKRGLNNSIPAIFVFGDSTSDAGNNNHIKTVFKCDFPPYGKDFPSQVATGRFSNGRIANDFIASYFGIKEYVPPYLDKKLSNEELLTGVTFASGGSGYDPLTPKISLAISMSEQIEHFKEYQKRIELLIGKEKTKSLVNNAIYIISAGTNDYVLNYFAIPIRRINYTVPDYMEFLVQQVQNFVQDLLNQGAKRIGVAGLAPMGCLPIVITSKSNSPFTRRGCVDYYSSVAMEHNQKLIPVLNKLQNSVQNSTLRIAYLDTYGPLLDMIIDKSKYEFEEVHRGCCGTGLIEVLVLCNPTSYVCPNASKHIFWDSIHPSERTYHLMFEALRPDLDYLITG